MSEARTMTYEAARSIGMPYRAAAAVTDTLPESHSRAVVHVGDAGLALSIFIAESPVAQAQAILSERQAMTLIKNLLCAMNEVRR